jgi:hypothetical protein
MANGTHGWCMAKAQKSRPRDNLIRWRVSLLGPTPGGWGALMTSWSMAPDAGMAEEQVGVAHEISETLRHRLIAIREDL